MGWSLSRSYGLGHIFWTAEWPASSEQSMSNHTWSFPHHLGYNVIPSLVQFSHCRVWLFLTPWTAARQASLSTQTHVRQCHPTISFSVIPFSSCPQSFPASGSFPMSQLFTSGGQSIGVSASTSVLPMNTQDWSPLGWTGWISLQSKGLSRVFSNTTVQKYQFFYWFYFLLN